MQIIVKELPYRVFKHVAKAPELKKARPDRKKNSRGDQEHQHRNAQNIIVRKAERSVQSGDHLVH